MDTVREVNVHDVPKAANAQTIHAIYKVKANEYGSINMKACIGPHGEKISNFTRWSLIQQLVRLLELGFYYP